MVDTDAGGPIRPTINAVFLSAERVRYPIAQFLFRRERADVAELAIVLEPLFVEPLVCRGVMGIGLIDFGVSEQILRVVRFQSRLDIQNQPVIGLLAGRVADSAQVEVLANVTIFWHKVPGNTSKLHTKFNSPAC